MNVTDIQNDFPLLEKVNYLSTASIGLVPHPVIEKSKDLFIELAQGGTLSLDEEKEVLVYDNLRQEGSRILKCDIEEIAVFNSVSEALNCIAWSLELEEGKVVSTTIEFPSVTYPWIRLAKKWPLTIDLVETKNWCVPENELLKRIDNQTKIVSLSHVEYLTGQKFDLSKIAEKTHEVGALLIIDGIQAAGQIPIDVKQLNVDIYIVGSYKWLCAPFGSAIGYISKKLYNKLEPAFVGWRSTKDIWDFNAVQMTFASTARKFEYSTSAYGVKYGFAESIKYLNRLGIEKIQNHNMKLIDILLKELNYINGIDIISPDSRASILTFKVDQGKIKDVGNRLRKLERPIEMSIRQGMIRLAPHFYNTDNDIIQFIDSLKGILKK